jgi:hypothetical protein
MHFLLPFLTLHTSDAGKYLLRCLLVRLGSGAQAFCRSTSGKWRSPIRHVGHPIGLWIAASIEQVNASCLAKVLPDDVLVERVRFDAFLR